MTSDITVRFTLPNERQSFRQFNMPGIPRVGEAVFVGDQTYTVESVAWALDNGVNGAEPIVILGAYGQ